MDDSTAPRALTAGELDALVRQLIDDHLFEPAAEGVLFGDLPPALRAHLPDRGTPAIRLRAALTTLNGFDEAAGVGGRPLGVVLRTARGLRSGSPLYQRLAEIVGGAAANSPAEPVTLAPAAPPLSAAHPVRARLLLGGALCCLIGGAIWWATRPAPPDPGPTPVSAASKAPMTAAAEALESAPDQSHRVCTVAPVTAISASLNEHAIDITPAISPRVEGWRVWVPAKTGIQAWRTVGESAISEDTTPCAMVRDETHICRGGQLMSVTRGTSRHWRLAVLSRWTDPPKPAAASMGWRGTPGVGAVWITGPDRLQWWTPVGRGEVAESGVSHPDIAVDPATKSTVIVGVTLDAQARLRFWPTPGAGAVDTTIRADRAALFTSKEALLLATLTTDGVEIHRKATRGWTRTARVAMPGTRVWAPHLVAHDAGVALVWLTERGASLRLLTATGELSAGSAEIPVGEPLGVGVASDGSRVGLSWIGGGEAGVQARLTDVTCAE